jgi:hypothetical protein
MSEMEISKGDMEVEEARKRFEARVKSMVDESIRRVEEEPAPQQAELLNWWNVWAVGPYQSGAFPQPGNIIKVGETAYVYTILWLNPYFPSGPQASACKLLSNLACRFRVQYCTGNFCTWLSGPGSLNVSHEVAMVPNQCYYVDVLRIDATTGMEGCYEMNICAHILGCPDNAAPPFAGFATRVYDVNPDLFYPYGEGVGARYEFDIPIKFMIYK